MRFPSVQPITIRLGELTIASNDADGFFTECITPLRQVRDVGAIEKLVEEQFNHLIDLKTGLFRPLNGN